MSEGFAKGNLLDFSDLWRQSMSPERRRQVRRDLGSAYSSPAPAQEDLPVGNSECTQKERKDINTQRFMYSRTSLTLHNYSHMCITSKKLCEIGLTPF